MQTCGKSSDTVLVIDDDPIMRELLTLLLAAEGHRVMTADCGEGALDLISSLPQDDRPSVLLADLTMPGLSRVPLACRLRQACPQTTLLLSMSAGLPTDAEVEAFDTFLTKPFGVEDYDAAVEHARIGPARTQAAPEGPANRGSATQTAPASAAQDAVPILNETIFSKLSSLMGNAGLPQLYNMFLDDAPVRIDRMSCAAALRDEETFVREAHAIKGGCGMLGATELHALAGNIEAGGLKCSHLLNDLGAAVTRLRRILEKRIPMRT